MHPSYRNPGAALLAALLVAFLMASCSKTEEERSCSVLAYANDNAHYVALTDFSPLDSEKPGQPPIADLINRFLTFYDPWAASLSSLEGIDRSVVMTIGDRSFMPLKRAILISPVKDYDRLAASLADLGYTALDGYGPDVFLSASPDERSAITDGKVVCFIHGRNIDSMVERVAELRAEAKAAPIAKWKRNTLCNNHLASFIIKNKLPDVKPGHIAIGLSFNGDYLMADARLHDAQGNEISWPTTDRPKMLDGKILDLLPNDCLLTSAMAWSDALPLRTFVPDLKPVPGISEQVWDSLRCATMSLVDAVAGTGVLSVSFRGTDIMNPTSYDISTAVQTRPNAARAIQDSFTDILKMADMPCITGLGNSTMTTWRDIPLSFMANSTDNILLAHLGPNERAKTSHRAADIDDLIGYLVIDITPVGPVASAVGQPLKIQLQVRLDTRGLTLNAAVNSDAVCFINSLLTMTTQY